MPIHQNTDKSGFLGMTTAEAAGGCDGVGVVGIADRRRADQTRHGSEALYREIVEQSPDAILVHFDSKMIGKALVRDIFKVRPGIPVILCGDVSRKATRKWDRAEGVREFITIPVDSSKLTRTNRYVLDRKARKG